METLLPGEITAGDIINDVLGAFLIILAVLELNVSFSDNLAGIINYCSLCVPFVDIDSQLRLNSCHTYTTISHSQV